MSTCWFHFGRPLSNTAAETPCLEQSTSIICPKQPLGDSKQNNQTNKSSAVKKYKMNLATAFDTIFQQFWHCAVYTLSWNSQRSIKCNFATVEKGALGSRSDSWNWHHTILTQYFDTTVFGQFLAGSASVRLSLSSCVQHNLDRMYRRKFSTLFRQGLQFGIDSLTNRERKKKKNLAKDDCPVMNRILPILRFPLQYESVLKVTTGKQYWRDFSNALKRGVEIITNSSLRSDWFNCQWLGPISSKDCR